MWIVRIIAMIAFIVYGMHFADQEAHKGGSFEGALALVMFAGIFYFIFFNAWKSEEKPVSVAEIQKKVEKEEKKKEFEAMMDREEERIKKLFSLKKGDRASIDYSHLIELEKRMPEFGGYHFERNVFIKEDYYSDSDFIKIDLYVWKSQDHRLTEVIIDKSWLDLFEPLESEEIS